MELACQAAEIGIGIGTKQSITRHSAEPSSRSATYNNITYFVTKHSIKLCCMVDTSELGSGRYDNYSGHARSPRALVSRPTHPRYISSYALLTQIHPPLTTNSAICSPSVYTSPSPHPPSNNAFP